MYLASELLIYTTVNTVQITLFHFEDELRKNAAAVVNTLKALCGLRVLMLTGDNASTAGRVAKLVEIDEFHAGLKPEDKLSRVKELTQEKGDVHNEENLPHFMRCQFQRDGEMEYSINVILTLM